MSMEVLQPEWYTTGFLPTIAIIAASLFIVQAVFTFLLWRKGETRFLFKFISFAIAAFVIFLGAIAWISVLSGGDEGILYAACGILVICAPIAIGIQVFFFIRDTWFPVEDEGKAITPSKKKEATT